jgi:hypothetical protein
VKNQHHLLEFGFQNEVTGWKCPVCALSGNFPNYNDITRSQCVYCGSINLELIEKFGLVRNLITQRRLGEQLFTMDKVELHAQFFNKAVTLVSDFDFPSLQNFIEENERILIEARANIGAAKDEARKRLAKLKPESKEWLVTGDEIDSSTSNSLITKKPRKSKLDKLIDTYSELGIEMPEELRTKIQKRVTEQEFKASVHSHLTTKPTRTAGMTDEDKGIPVKSEENQLGSILNSKLPVDERKPTDNSDGSKKFDPSKFKSYLNSLKI